jgi:hypothetical protein
MIKISDDLFVNPDHVSHVVASPNGFRTEIWFASGRYRDVAASVIDVVELLNANDKPDFYSPPDPPPTSSESVSSAPNSGW